MMVQFFLCGWLSGHVFYAGLLMLTVMVSWCAWRSSAGRGFVVVASLTVTALFMVLASGTPLPVLGYLILPVVAALWLALERTRHRARVAARAVVVAAAVTAAVYEWPYYAPPRVGAEPVERVMLVGDSVTAGIGPAGEATWGTLLAHAYDLPVVDVARAGATVDSALAEQAPRLDQAGPGLVVLQIGGNDMLYGTAVDQFERRLNELVHRVARPGRRVVMLELPAFPLREGHTRSQRRVARQHGVTMIPRRYFLSVIRPAKATRDGVHLTEAGHRRMFEMIDRVVGPALAEAQR